MEAWNAKRGFGMPIPRTQGALEVGRSKTTFPESNLINEQHLCSLVFGVESSFEQSEVDSARLFATVSGLAIPRDSMISSSHKPF